MQKHKHRQMSKLQRVVHLLSLQQDPDVSKDVTYVNRLHHDIAATEKFIEQADHAIGALEHADRSDDSETSQRKRVVALYDSYARLGYLPGKDEVIGVASASHLVEQSVENQNKHLDLLATTSAEPDVTKIGAILKDYTDLLTQSKAVREENELRLRELTAKIDELNPQDVVPNAVEVLETKLKECRNSGALLNLHMKRVITKFLALQNWEDGSILDETTLLGALKLNMTLLRSLLVTSGWVEVIPDQYNDKIIKLLQMNDIVEHKREGNDTFLRMRNFLAI